jgi:DNA-binding MltR family transcriptional regulator
MPRRPILPVEDLSADTQKFFDVLNQSSDLGVVLVTASYLDASIGSLLHRHFQTSAVSDKLLDIQGPLGTISARADIAYALGLINKALYQDLLKMIEIRNAFAHHHLEQNFQVAAIGALCDELRYVFSLRAGATDQPLGFGEIARSSRDKFVISAVLISQQLLLRGLGVKRVAVV